MRKQKNPVHRCPSSGIWYYVYLKPDWKLVAECGDTLQHMTYWPRVIVPMLAAHYGLDVVAFNMLMPLSESMPRGRVTSELYGESCTIAHGNDFPSGTFEDEQLAILVKAFKLGHRCEHDKVMIVFEEHETMRPDHKRRLQKIIGKVPY